MRNLSKSLYAFACLASVGLATSSAFAEAEERRLRVASPYSGEHFDPRVYICLNDPSSRLNLRITPDLKQGPLGKLLHGQYVSVLAGVGFTSLSQELSSDHNSREGWVLVAHEDGRIGWIATKYICAPGTRRTPTVNYQTANSSSPINPGQVRPERFPEAPNHQQSTPDHTTPAQAEPAQPLQPRQVPRQEPTSRPAPSKPVPAPPAQVPKTNKAPAQPKQQPGYTPPPVPSRFDDL